ncbi:MAG: hypothetical protein ABSG74_06810 [Candidatus Bathyarchaeia archaeon]
MTSDRALLENTWLEARKIRAGLEVMLKKNGYWDAYLRKLDEERIKLVPGA